MTTASTLSSWRSRCMEGSLALRPASKSFQHQESFQKEGPGGAVGGFRTSGLGGCTKGIPLGWKPELSAAALGSPPASSGLTLHDPPLACPPRSQTMLRRRGRYLGGVPAVAWVQVQKDKNQLNFQGEWGRGLVSNRAEDVLLGSGSPVVCLAWLGPGSRSGRRLRSLGRRRPAIAARRRPAMWPPAIQPATLAGKALLAPCLCCPCPDSAARALTPLPVP